MVVPPDVIVTLRLPVVAVVATVILALILVSDATVNELTVIPEPKLTASAVGLVKLVPVITTDNVSPWYPVDGVTLVTLPTPNAVTSNVAVIAILFEVTVTVRSPVVALDEIVNGTDAALDAVTVTVPTVIPLPLTLTVGAYVLKCVPVPLIATVTVCPCSPVSGDKLTVGALTANTLFPREIIVEPLYTITFLLPAVVELAILILAEIEVAPETVNEFTVIPVPRLMDVAPVKLVPLIAISTVSP
jgi:hypothetical protein